MSWLSARLLAATLGAWPAVDYTMELRLDEHDHTVRGKGTISFQNTSERELPELWFHLYMNAFEHEQTLFLRPLPTSPSGSRSGRSLRQPGGTEVRSLVWREQGPENLWDKAAPHSPGDPQDRTDIAVPLPVPLAPGHSATLDVEFETRLPELVERTGYDGDFHLVSGFYPKLARLSPTGEFDHFSYHPLAEFSANFGSYRVELDVPSHHQIGSTGSLTRLQETGRRASYLSTSERVHDFAFTAWPGFTLEERTIEGVQIRLLLPKNETSLGPRYFATVAAVLAENGARYGPYPHPTLTVVHPPRSAAPAGGMEYPQFITTGDLGWPVALGAHALELVTAHELSHQWFQGMLGSNEYREPWLDESLATFSEHRYLERHFGHGSLFSSPVLELSEPAVWRFMGIGGQKPNAFLTAPEYGSFEELARTIYARAVLALETIRRVYGEELFDLALRDYSEAHRFGHPTTQDFFAALSGRLALDAVDNLHALLEGATAGYRWAHVTTERTSSGYRTSALAELEGSVTLPTVVRGRFADGSAQVISLRGTTRVEFDHASPLVELALDPETTLAIDPDRTNNRYRPSSTLRQSGTQSLLGTLVVLALSALLG